MRILNSEMLVAICSELTAARELLSEIYKEHRDPNSAYYNNCDNGEDCQWCVEAEEIINGVDLIGLDVPDRFKLNKEAGE